MTEHDFHPSRRIARSTPNSPGGELAPRIRTLATDTVTPRDRSLPAALCTVAAEVGFETANGTDSANATAFADVLEPVVTTVTLLEGYVRLRLTLVDAAEALADWGAPTVDRDDAILASDFLHASAYATVAETPVPDRRRLELYRLLLGGSTTLTRQCLARADADERADANGASDGRFEAPATLAETAGAIGATVVGASAETRTALRRYSHAMMTALASQSSATSDDDDPRASAARVLFDPTCQHAVVTDEELAYATPTVERSLERARTALEALADDAAGTDVSSPLGRLERATRVPFHRE
ncbi:hypothetical protein [Natronorubrum texcoconense]|uniref:hypothetical protein n=1 Tax=Natronorubrum texcoconense TaxID=1095776 RepID=UPI001FE0D520|nr:hypothetical protein [Natronorubrum texcoconense]